MGLERASRPPVLSRHAGLPSGGPPKSACSWYVIAAKMRLRSALTGLAEVALSPPGVYSVRPNPLVGIGFSPAPPPSVAASRSLQGAVR